ncbi:uncharacterized protein LOC117788970 [Drosophila innubila]|uniref:uncharacterized protein LOC117788970 n=1 Tax=Drosophila innubila TaxID=198719 RepID=UPI00148CF632|nr:uncharacterized protein LOC117788970 [Drosophila innubila]
MHKEKEYCICDLSLDLDYINAEDVDNADCLEALMLVQLQLSLHNGHMARERQMEMGGVANGGHLLGLIAFARKIARVLLSLSLLCCILFLSFYLGNNYDSHNGGTSAYPQSTTIDTSLVSSSSSTSTTTTITSVAINNTSSTIENNNHLAETYSI